MKIAEIIKSLKEMNNIENLIIVDNVSGLPILSFLCANSRGWEACTSQYLWVDYREVDSWIEQGLMVETPKGYFGNTVLWHLNNLTKQSFPNDDVVNVTELTIVSYDKNYVYVNIGGDLFELCGDGPKYHR